MYFKDLFNKTHQISLLSSSIFSTGLPNRLTAVKILSSKIFVVVPSASFFTLALEEYIPL